MAKSKAGSQKKRRRKSYTGEDAAIQGEKITRIKAVPKSRGREWFENNRMRLAVWLAILGSTIIFYFVTSFLLRWIF